MSATGTTAAAPSPLQVLFTNLGNQLLADAAGNISGLLQAFFTNVQKTPTPQNVAAQGAILMASAMLQLPNLEGQAISQFAAAGMQALALIKVPTL